MHYMKKFTYSQNVKSSLSDKEDEMLLWAISQQMNEEENTDVKKSCDVT